jgi:4-hydroxy 2-oxovalerate aldolase
MAPILLDCTLRDGGYYTAWDFEKKTVDTYIKAMNKLPIDYVEIGYRNNPLKEYQGKYGYCPVFELENIRKTSAKKIAIMLNEKTVQVDDLTTLLETIKGLVDMVRVAVDPDNFDRALLLVESVKRYGFEVAFNVMYMSKWKKREDFYINLEKINDTVDLFVMVDSYGSVTPEEVADTFKTIKKKLNCRIGFHGHNNLELAFINTLTAIELGVDCVDATILGMGRGAGNLKTELLLTYLNKNFGLEVDFNILGNAVAAFSDLLEKYRWGTNLPYMLSGANSFPQKEVMDWLETRYYSFNDIIRALQNKKYTVLDNAKYPLIAPCKYDQVIIIGGGPSAVLHADGIKYLVRHNSSIALIHASGRNARFYEDIDVPQYFCLVGREGERLDSLFVGRVFTGIGILPPYPRLMGTYVPECAKDMTFELPAITFTDNYLDYCTTIALETAYLLCDNDIFIAGYDGYAGNILAEKEQRLTARNRELFAEFAKISNRKVVSLNATLYPTLDIKSCYQYL